MANRLIAEFVDVAGGYLRSGNWGASSAISLPYTTALAACSNANLNAFTAGVALTSSPAASSGAYPLVTDVAVLNFVSVALGRVQLTIPSPVASIFGSDGVTVDPTNPLVAALISAATGYLADVNGNPVSAFMQGVKSSRRVEQNG